MYQFISCIYLTGQFELELELLNDETDELDELEECELDIDELELLELDSELPELELCEDTTLSQPVVGNTSTDSVNGVRSVANASNCRVNR